LASLVSVRTLNPRAQSSGCSRFGLLSVGPNLDRDTTAFRDSVKNDITKTMDARVYRTGAEATARKRAGFSIDSLDV
jgi:hypothetical protein